MTRSLQAGMSGPSAPTRTRPPRRLPRWRNLLLTTHVVVAVGVLGPDLVLLTPAVTGLASGDPELIRAGYLVMGLLAEAVLVPLALAALTIGTATAAVFVLRPALNRAAAQALQVPVAELSTAGIGRFGVAVTLAPAGALLVPVATVALAVFKPWGQTRFRRR
jgi:hypothetical protein